VAAGGAVVAAAGCGIPYPVAESAAASRLEEARILGAAELAPYEYYDAREHLEQAQVEADRARNSDATRLAHVAEQRAAAAIALTQHARRERP